MERKVAALYKKQMKAADKEKQDETSGLREVATILAGLSNATTKQASASSVKGDSAESDNVAMTAALKLNSILKNRKGGP